MLTTEPPTGFEVGSGVLYYAKSGDTSRIVKNRPEMQGIIMGRNEMAGWLQAKKLPPMLQDLRKCQRCFAVDACTVYHKVRFCWSARKRFAQN